MSKQTIEFTVAQASIRAITEIAAEYLDICNHLIAVSAEHPGATAYRTEETNIPPDVAFAMSLLMQGAGSSTNTLVKLSQNIGLNGRDCYTIARSIIETLVNASYIAVGGSTRAQAAIRHARQKSVLDLNRVSKVGDSEIRVSYSGSPTEGFGPELDAAIEEFTAKSGREKSWTEESIDDRIVEVGRVCGADVLGLLHSARFSVYRHSSEVLHGSLFGAMYFLGATSPNGQPKSKEAIEEIIAEQMLLILIGVVLGWAALVGVFHRTFGFNTAFERSNRLRSRLSELPLFDRI